MSKAKRTAAVSKRRAAATKALPKATKATAGRTSIAQTPVSIRTEGITLDAAAEAYIRKRMGLKLGKFGAHLTRVSVRFENIARDRRTPEVACRIKTVLPNLASVIVESRHHDVRAAFDETADAHERAVRRLLDKRSQAKSRS